jgi:hypothetical protein
MKGIAAITVGLVLNGLPGWPQTVSVPAPEPYSYDKGSIRQMRERGEYGRYLVFRGTTTLAIHPVVSQGTVVPGRELRREFIYELDCLQRSFNRRGDPELTVGGNGWQAVRNDPVAEAVANAFCDAIDTLPRADDAF